MNSAVFFAKVPDYEEELLNSKVESAFQSFHFGGNWTEETKILLKPNLLSKSAPQKAITTHPAVVEAVINACVRRGVKPNHLTLADSAGGFYNPKQTLALYETTGMAAVAKRTGISLYSACESQTVPVSGSVVSEFSILTPVLEADVIINLPKFKTHVMTGMTACVKNMFGCIPGLEKSKWHTRFPERLPFGDMLVDLYELLPPHFSLVDGILAMEGDGPGGGTPRDLGLLLAGVDSFAVDLAIAEMMGLTAMEIPYLKAGNLRGLCGESFPSADALGEGELFSKIPQWQLPASYSSGASADTTFSQFLPKFLRPLGRKVEESFAPRPVVVSKDCISCRKCSEICSKNAISFPSNRAYIHKKQCIRCFCCHEVCPVNAIAVVESKLFHH